MTLTTKSESIPLIDQKQVETAPKAESPVAKVEASRVDKKSEPASATAQKIDVACVTDLDELVQKWINFMYAKTNETKSKKTCFQSKKPAKSTVELKDLQIDIDWSNITFKQTEAVFNTSKQKSGSNTTQTLLTTSFVNNTSQEQESSFKMERSTSQICEFSFSKGFKTNQKAPAIGLLIPQDITNIDASVKRDQELEPGKSLTTKEDVTWKCDSLIKVSPNTTTYGSLVITEMELDRTFTAAVFIEGRLHVKLKKKKQTNGIVQSFSADMHQIIELALKNGWFTGSESSLEVLEDSKLVKCTFHGECKFRLGYNQRVELKEVSHAETAESATATATSTPE